MKKDIIANELLLTAKRLLADYEIDQKLFWAKSKTTARNILHRYIDPMIRGIWKDNYWKGPNNVFKKLRELGVDLDVTVKDGGYYQRDNGNPGGKVYNLDIEYKNIEGKVFKMSGTLTCAFCGTVDDPMSAYDMVFQIY